MEAVLVSWEDYSSPPFEPGSGLAVVSLSHPFNGETEVEISFSHMKRPYSHEAVVYKRGDTLRLDRQEFDNLENILEKMGYTLIEKFTPSEPRGWRPIPATSSRTITLMLGMKTKNPLFVTLETTRYMREGEVLNALYKFCQNDCGFGWLDLIEEDSMCFRLLSASRESSPSMSVGDFVVFVNSELPQSNRIYRCDNRGWTEVEHF